MRLEVEGWRLEVVKKKVGEEFCRPFYGGNEGVARLARGRSGAFGRCWGRGGRRRGGRHFGRYLIRQ